ncbi:UNVERIFIED_CONTAM: hypothetical protein Scaly_1065100 [Sesamum calycinum]|uniref:Endonuclease/exonuclease/phosphatase domain-containing protein n=1 Tax=Sesamum calycinum TaxID=2727403 RepID=A0AAW2QM22_9LAMI
MNEGLSTVASGIGRPLYQDAITKARMRLDCACVCVILDISSKLPKHIVIMVPKEDGGDVPCRVDIEYEWKVENEGSKADRGRIREEPIICASTTPSDPVLREHVREQQVPPNLVGWESQSYYLIGNSLVIIYGPGNRIWLAWKYDGLDVDVLTVHEQVIHCRVFIRQIHTAVLVFVVYGATDLGVRRDLWQTLCHITDSIDIEPWLVLGDFNALADISEGALFTWHNCSDTSRSLWKRLDRMLVNDRWLDRWPFAFYVSLTPRTSNHSPLIFKGNLLDNHVKDKSPGPDSYSSGFYKAAWPVIAKEVIRAIMEFFFTGCLLRQLNATMLALVPKYNLHLQSLNSDLSHVASEYSISLFKRGLEMFASLSGLHVSLTKSHLILSKSAQHNHDRLLRVFRFRETHLPVLYIGFPLISCRLSLSDFLMSFNIYWAMAFILPKELFEKLNNGCGLSYGGFGMDTRSYGIKGIVTPSGLIGFIMFGCEASRFGQSMIARNPGVDITFFDYVRCYAHGSFIQ